MEKKNGIYTNDTENERKTIEINSYFHFDFFQNIVSKVDKNFSEGNKN